MQMLVQVVPECMADFVLTYLVEAPTKVAAAEQVHEFRSRAGRHCYNVHVNPLHPDDSEELAAAAPGEVKLVRFPYKVDAYRSPNLDSRCVFQQDYAYTKYVPLDKVLDVVADLPAGYMARVTSLEDY